MSTFTPQFKKAWNEAQQLTQQPNNDELIKMWALGKIAKGEDVAKPGAFDFKGKAKYPVWEKLKGEGMTKDKAQTEYVKHVETLKPKYAFDSKKAVSNPIK